MDNDERGAGAKAPGRAPFKTVAQYLKHLSFKSSGAPGAASGAAPRTDYTFTVNRRDAGPNAHEVELKLKVRGVREEIPVYVVELAYAGIFRIAAPPGSDARAVAMVECPRFLFPFARRIVSDCVCDGGFPRPALDPIDFGALFRGSRRGRRNGGGGAPASALH